MGWWLESSSQRVYCVHHGYGSDGSHAGGGTVVLALITITVVMVLLLQTPAIVLEGK